jgi:hypothetical protein
VKYPLILDRLFPTRSTASIPGGVPFSLWEKEPGKYRKYALFTVLLSNEGASHAPTGRTSMERCAGRTLHY